MKKKLLGLTKTTSKDGFRYRGIQTTRLENLTDAVFGFSITLLVISSEVPTTYIELQASMYSFIGFIFCTMLLLGLWNNHSNFFLYYGLNDKTTKILNALFLFVLLFYIYPLKYLFSFIGTAIYASIKRSMGDTSEALRTAYTNLKVAELNVDQWQDLMIRFGLGLFFIYLIIIFMHVNAMKKAEELNLNAREKYITRTFINEYFILMSIAVIAILIVVIFGGKAAGYSGMTYLLTAIVVPVYNGFRRKRMKGLNFD